MQRALILENIDGHRLRWLELLLSELPSDEVIKLYMLNQKSNSSKLPRSFKNLILCEFETNSKLKLIKFAKSDCAKLGIYQSIFFDGDNWLIYQFLLKNQMTSIIMRPYIQKNTIKSKINYQIKRILIHTLLAVKNSEFGQLRIPLDTSAGYSIEKLVDTYDMLPILSQTKTQARNELGIRLDSTLIVIPGFIDRRKLSNKVIKVFYEKIRQCDYSFLFIGKIDSEVYDDIKRLPSENVYIRDAYVSDHQIVTALKASDSAFLLYNDFVASSGLIVGSVRNNVKVIIRDLEQWKNFAIAHSNLVTTSSNNVLAISNAIEESLSVDLTPKAQFVESNHRSTHQFLLGTSRPTRSN